MGGVAYILVHQGDKFKCNPRTGPELQNMMYFIPGHAGFLAGSRIPYDILELEDTSNIDIMKMIYNRLYSLHKLHEDNSVYNRITNKILLGIGDIQRVNQEAAADCYEFWEWQERQAKFIINAIWGQVPNCKT